MNHTALLTALLLTPQKQEEEAPVSGPLPDPRAFEAALESALQKALVGPVAEAIRRAKLPLYLSRKEVLDLTGWSDRKLSYLQAQRRLPYVKRGRTVLFKAADVEAYMLEGYVPAKGRSKSKTTEVA